MSPGELEREHSVRLRVRPFVANADEAWLLAYVHEDENDAIDEIDLGRHPGLDAAKAAPARRPGRPATSLR
ncbi:hypothetical protein GCM10010112_23230 [Actinoplanes lobatus]|uniref:Uncharacterized protein n=1 Tax=Actinoplanes lobatus TaxID=113568 RepID=A0A7W7MIU5_9ACTN|nr:hypothetical protein [Actinoplanes lobatus]MBB4751365.1 hypothetical protein [Actinoplanes lobatus]GGN63712.1 hypothetical protein GCM10010112_23230 [Actinoplanes lobatus]GIE40975.1 hypothetical protein Alo02nite_38730 [Actinoplanes lobatus]